MFPKRNVYVISSIAEDKSIDNPKPKRINVLYPEFMFDEFTAENFKDSLVIADDVDVFPTKIKKKVLTIINSILQIGRHFNVSLCFTTHNPELRHWSLIVPDNEKLALNTYILVNSI